MQGLLLFVSWWYTKDWETGLPHAQSRGVARDTRRRGSVASESSFKFALDHHCTSL